jgi:hypothetical protein
MSEIGRKGGEAVSRDRQHMREIGKKGGSNAIGVDQLLQITPKEAR